MQDLDPRTGELVPSVTASALRIAGSGPHWSDSTSSSPAPQVLVDPAKKGPYQDRPLLCPFGLLPLLTCSGSTLAFLKIQGPKSKNIENTILLQP